MMDYQQVPLNKRAARGRNGVFDAELIEMTIEWQEPEHVPLLVVEVWSRRRAEGQAPIRFTFTTSEASSIQIALSDMIEGATRAEQAFYGETWQAPAEME
jgi:hypothetical protein